MNQELHKKPVIGIMGASATTESENKKSYEMGALVARENWVTLTGGAPVGAMEYASKGAKEHAGIVVGIMFAGRDSPLSTYVDIPIYTNMKSGRNYLNILSSDVVVVTTQLSRGTLTEVALAMAENRPIVALCDNAEDEKFLIDRGGDLVHIATSPAAAMDIIKTLI